jgi:CBS-domain-containing membrane protein
MQAKDVMSTYVITVGPDLDIPTAAKILVRNGISAAPVVDLEEGKLLGIISEGDLMRRAETGTERRPSWWLEMFSSTQHRAEEFIKANARRVRDVMTTKVVTAGPDTSLREIANLLEKHNIKRVPILDQGRLLGVVSRANLVQALASRTNEVTMAQPCDTKLRAAVVKNLRKQPGNAALVNVFAEEGVVSLWGNVSTEAEKNSIRVAAEMTPGVRAVNDNILVGRYATL